MKLFFCFLLTTPLLSTPLYAGNSVEEKASCCAGVQGHFRGERFPQTRRSLLSPAQISALTKADLRYAINEIYARHGLTFQDTGLQEDFCRRPWYRPQPKRTALQIEAALSSIEKANLKTLAQERAKRHSALLKKLQGAHQ